MLAAFLILSALAFLLFWILTLAIYPAKKQRKQVERAIRESERRLEAWQEAKRVVVNWIDEHEPVVVILPEKEGKSA